MKKVSQDTYLIVCFIELHNMNCIVPHIHYFTAIRDKIVKIVYKHKEKIIESIRLQVFDKLIKK